MKKSEIQVIIDRLSIIFRTIPNINRGGCGLFAHVVYENLLKMGIKPKLFVTSPKRFKVPRKLYEMFKNGMNQSEETCVNAGKAVRELSNYKILLK